MGGGPVVAVPVSAVSAGAAATPAPDSGNCRAVGLAAELVLVMLSFLFSGGALLAGFGSRARKFGEGSSGEWDGKEERGRGC
jgi:hypothetical protein